MESDQSKQPELSIVVVAYNEEEYIEETLEKIIAQKTNFEYEVLCHDDASTDRTQEIIMEFVKKYPDIIIPIFQKDNKMQKGHQVIFEYCYPKARGKYIAYCDGDDYWSDVNKLQRQYDFLESHEDYTLCLHNFDFLEVENGNRYTSNCGQKDRDMKIEEFILWDAQRIPQLGTSMFRTTLAKERPELFVKIGGGKKSLRPISDYPLYIYLALNGKVRYLADSMSIWRRRGFQSWGITKEWERINQFNLDKIAFLKELNQLTAFRNNEIIQKVINRCLFINAWNRMDFKEASKFSSDMDRGWGYEKTIFLMSLFPGIAKKLLEYKRRNRNN